MKSISWGHLPPSQNPSCLGSPLRSHQQVVEMEGSHFKRYNKRVCLYVCKNLNVISVALCDVLSVSPPILCFCQRVGPLALSGQSPLAFLAVDQFLRVGAILA